MREQSLGEALVELGEIYRQVAIERGRGCPDSRVRERPPVDVKTLYRDRIRELRTVLNERLAGINGSDSRQRGPWPAGDHLRRRMRFLGDAADGATANTWYPQTVAAEWFVRYPGPPRGARLHVPYLFVHLRAGGKGRCDHASCRAPWHPGERHRDAGGLPSVTTTLEWHPRGASAHTEIAAIADAVARRAR